jgi:hypothetical protein
MNFGGSGKLRAWIIQILIHYSSHNYNMNLLLQTTHSNLKLKLL